MKPISLFRLTLLFAIAASAVSCQQEDPGPLQYAEQSFSVTDFDRLDIGDAMIVTVQPSAVFSILAKGDRRNIDDLEIYRNGSTLIAKYRRNENRQHATSIVIGMPVLKAANFSGATTSTISGVVANDNFYLTLSGAAVSQLDLNSGMLNLVLSGASNLTLSGAAVDVSADISGASLLKAYMLQADHVQLTASGASHAYVMVNQSLKADASGASTIFYRGDASVDSKVSGGSTVQKD